MMTVTVELNDFRKKNQEEMKELKPQNEIFKQQNDELKQEVEFLKRRVEQIEKILNKEPEQIGKKQKYKNNRLLGIRY